MMNSEAPRFISCKRCEKGLMIPIHGEQRFTWYNGARREIPSGMFVRTCQVCGETLLDDEELRFLAEVWT